MNHTDGIWEYQPLHSPSHTNDFIVTSKTDYICLCDAVEGKKKNEANARLIAAAPELLEACESILKDYGYDSSIRSQLESLIKQAKGE